MTMPSYAHEITPCFFIAIVLISLTCGCAKTENGLVFGTPYYEKRNIEVTEIDLAILERTSALLANIDHWDKSLNRECNPAVKLTLACALEKASIEALGEYVHRQPALQEVRFVINDHYRDRWHVHRLVDFNANELTSFSDITFVIDTAMEKVRNKLSNK